MKLNFRNLLIWERSMDLVTAIYEVSRKYPSDERFGLTSQIRRAAVSVLSNISEGCGRSTNTQFAHFIDISVGSICEVETQLRIA